MSKFVSLVIKTGDGQGCYTGFIQKHPAVCAQGDSVDEVQQKLSKYLKLYFTYMSNSDIEVESEQLQYI